MTLSSNRVPDDCVVAPYYEMSKQSTIVNWKISLVTVLDYASVHLILTEPELTEQLE